MVLFTIRHLRLRAEVAVRIAYEDRTKFGSPVSDRPQQTTRRLFAPVVEQVMSRGYARLMENALPLLRASVQSPRFLDVARPDGRGAWELQEALLYPDASAAPPARLQVGTVRRDVPVADWPLAHELIAALCGGGVATSGEATSGDRLGLLSQLEEAGLLTDAEPAPPDRGLLEAPLTFMGHNAVVVRSGSHAVLIDPMLMPHSDTFPAGYQPLTVGDIGPVDAIVITHSHPDHFDPATLLRFPPQTTVVVPRLEAETFLSFAMGERARELGFTDVRELGWGESVTIGNIEVHALPFYGEQPTDGEVLHPEIRNAGNTYLVRTPALAAAFLADSGRDGLGDSKTMAAEARARMGAVDVVFCGYRSWLSYPVQLLFSSVARYLLFVPPWRWACRQQIMNGIDDALDVAERWGARTLVPYADGGAPWFWQIGLGPRLDDAAAELPGFDPFPERVLEAARCRAATPGGLLVGTSVRVALLRPGDSIVKEGEVVRAPGHAWPYGDRP
jgi:L-ascorbate metabolism protein UlaG (beta-lactamase superfamily)